MLSMPSSSVMVDPIGEKMIPLYMTEGRKNNTAVLSLRGD